MSLRNNPSHAGLIIDKYSWVPNRDADLEEINWLVSWSSIITGWACWLMLFFNYPLICINHQCHHLEAEVKFCHDQILGYHMVARILTTLVKDDA